MKASWAARHRRGAQVVGAVVLVALGWAVVAMLATAPPIAAKLTPAPKVPAVTKEVPVPELPMVGITSQLAGPRTAPTVRGIVRLPGGEPAEGASVAVLRAVTAWPEWRSEELDRATTRRDGAFQFRFADANGLLVVFTHPQFAGDTVELLQPGEALELQLAPGFELYGQVSNDAGVPLANARVALEAVPGEFRRVAVTTTAANGGYRFTNLPAGPVRLVARHPDWQPASQPAVVVGDQRRVDVRCDRPAMTPLAGHVVSAATGAPVAGASVELLPLNGKLGLVDAIAARTGADGAFLLTGLPRGSMRLLVRHPDHGASLRTETVGLAKKDLTIE
ncbi:MAG: carboxypeptidase-like regulatory domain-containing protein, partial [Planctomycetota bacterium]